MRILKDFKIPDFKLPKFKMKEIANIDELDVKEDGHKNVKTLPKRGPNGYPPTKYKDIKEVFERSTELFRDRPFILYKKDHKEPYYEATYGEFRADVIGFGTGLTELTKEKDCPVVIIGETSYSWYVSYITLLIGPYIAVPVDKELPPNEIENVINRSKAKIVIYSSKKKEVIDKIKSNLKTVNHFVEMNSDNDIKNKDVGMNHLINKGKDFVVGGNNSYMNYSVVPEAFKVLLFTSGTTSDAKGVMLCHRNLAENINAASAYVHIHEEDRMFSILPLHHTYESTIGFLLPLAHGTSIAICEGLKHIVPNLKEAKPTLLIAVPLLVESLHKKITDNIKKSKKEGLVNSMIHITNALKAGRIDIKRKVFSEIHENLGGKLRIIVSAAAPIDPKVGKWVENIGITFLQGYGLTETAPIAAITPEYKPKVGSVGKAVICSDIKIDNPNENGEGEILIKSSTLMLGYYEDEEATKAVMEGDYFHSGDIGYLDNEGFLYLTGRSKNVIVTQNGKNIYPEEIENVLKPIDIIEECMIYGKEKEGEKELIITALVAPNYVKIEEKHGKDLSKDEIYKLIWEEIKVYNKKLSSYKVIKSLEIKEGDFEKTTTMKIKRFAEIEKVNNK
ncbi:MAG: AMP-binding protein [Clostridia bacterium]|nr:AMP-binding protein [Clostridia bacterium]